MLKSASLGPDRFWVNSFSKFSSVIGLGDHLLEDCVTDPYLVYFHDQYSLVEQPEHLFKTLIVIFCIIAGVAPVHSREPKV